jgi:hypothetical protein
MDQEEVKMKLRQIEEQAQLTLSEFPSTLTKQRQRMIVALARYLRTELEPADATQPLGVDREHPRH